MTHLDQQQNAHAVPRARREHSVVDLTSTRRVYVPRIRANRFW